MRGNDGNVNTNGLLDLDNGLDWVVLGAYSFSCLICLLAEGILSSVDCLVELGLIGMFIRRNRLRGYFHFCMMMLVSLVCYLC
jgi:hypothetical protein